MRWIGLVELVLFATFCPTVLASGQEEEIRNLEPGLPVELEDAFPIADRTRQIQNTFRYLQTREGEDQFVLRPVIEGYFTPRWLFRVGAPFVFGDVERERMFGQSDRTGSGNPSLEIFHAINQEFGYVPAFAFSARADLPAVGGSRGVDGEFRVIATKFLGTSGIDRVHVNAAWLWNDDHYADEREHRYLVAAGYSHFFEPSSTVVIASYLREQEIELNKANQMIELGIRQLISPITILSLGTGIGIGDSATHLRVTFGIQYTF